MERIKFIDHKGKEILLEDFSGLKPGEEFDKTLEEAKKTIHSQPASSVLALFDATDAYFNSDVMGKMKIFTKSNNPYMKAVAVVGITGLLKIALITVTRFTGRDFKSFNTREEALEWLVTQ
ncbi:MAG: STAS/SEC14 domain-containing protein [bacterium]